MNEQWVELDHTNRLNTIIETMVAGLIITTREGYIESVNPRIELLSEYAADELVGLHLSFLFGTGMVYSEFMQQIEERSCNKLCKIQMRSKNKGNHFVVMSMGSFENTNGSHRNLLCILDATSCVDFE